MMDGNAMTMCLAHAAETDERLVGGLCVVCQTAEIERLRSALENAEQFVDLYLNGVSSISDGMQTLDHIKDALGNI